MGCDIHIILERKYKDKWVGVKILQAVYHFTKNFDTGEWSQDYVQCPASSRNYMMFGKLANVRWQEEGNPEPKGMPEDASELARAEAERWDGDGHSHSYCTPEEFFQAATTSHHQPAEVFLAEHPAVKNPYMYYFGEWTPEDGEEYRLVFWFDN